MDGGNFGTVEGAPIYGTVDGVTGVVVVVMVVALSSAPEFNVKLAGKNECEIKIAGAILDAVSCSCS